MSTRHIIEPTHELAWGRRKLRGRVFDPLGTTPHTYVEQARQTILSQCRESMLFCYGALHRDHGPEDVTALRSEVADLLRLAEFVAGQLPRGVGTYKPPNSSPGEDAYVFNFITIRMPPRSMTALIADR